MKVFISQPMHGLSEQEIETRRADIVNKLTEVTDKEIEVVNPIQREDAPENAGRLWYIGRAISDMDGCDLVIFANGWRAAKGCHSEREVVDIYDVKYLYETELDLMIGQHKKLDI